MDQKEYQSKMFVEKEYQENVKEKTPTHNLLLQMLKAFIVGGLICVLGQWITNMSANYWNLDEKSSGMVCSLVLIFLSALFTGFGWYSAIAKFGGAGALVPITGFANSVAAAAIEFKKEGQVFGVGSKIFIIAGPVILYGIFTSWVLGLLYWIGKCLGWV